METSAFRAVGGVEFSCGEMSVNSTDADKVICVFLQCVFPLGLKLQKNICLKITLGKHNSEKKGKSLKKKRHFTNLHQKHNYLL